MPTEVLQAGEGAVRTGTQAVLEVSQLLHGAIAAKGMHKDA